jgi:hypothetical protein
MMKKNLIRILHLIIIPILSLSSCKPAISIASKTYTDNIANMNRVFITMKGMEGTKTYYLKLKDLLKIELNKRGIESETYLLDPSSVTKDSSVIKMIDSYKPGFLFEINQTESQESFRKNLSSSNSFFMDIRESNHQSLIGEIIYTTYTFGAFEEVAKLSCNRIIKHLEKNGIIKKL